MPLTHSFSTPAHIPSATIPAAATVAEDVRPARKRSLKSRNLSGGRKLRRGTRRRAQDAHPLGGVRTLCVETGEAGLGRGQLLRDVHAGILVREARAANGASDRQRRLVRRESLLRAILRAILIAISAVSCGPERNVALGSQTATSPHLQGKRREWDSNPRAHVAMG